MTWLFKNVFGKSSGNGFIENEEINDFDPAEMNFKQDNVISDCPTGPEETAIRDDGDSADMNIESGDMTGDLQGISLSDSEAASIMALITEEKLALDVYSALADEFDLGILDNLEAAETIHLGALTDLAEKYDLDTSVADLGEGVFNNESFQDLYNELVAQGSQSQEAALEVIALIEEMDISDLIDYSEGVDNQDISAVYTMLQNGSETNLAAVLNLLQDLKVDYSAQELTQDQIDAILEQSLSQYLDTESLISGDYLV